MAAYASSASGGGTTGTSNRTASITPAVGDLLVVAYNTSANTNLSATVTDDQGGTYTQIEYAQWEGSVNTAGVYVRDQLVTSAVAHTITAATGSNTAGVIGVIAISGMSKVGAAAVLQSAKVENEASATTPAPAFSAAALTTNLTIACAFNGRNTAQMSPPSGWTERLDIGQPSTSTGIEVATRDSGFTGTTITWGGTYGGTLGGAAVILELDATSVIDVSVSDTLLPKTSETLSIAAFLSRADVLLPMLTEIADVRVLLARDDQLAPKTAEISLLTALYTVTDQLRIGLTEAASLDLVTLLARALIAGIDIEPLLSAMMDIHPVVSAVPDVEPLVDADPKTKA